VLSLQDLGIAAADVGESASLSRVRRMYIPEKGRAEMIEGAVDEQAARLAQIIKDVIGGAA
jgi:electron transfer flavoprotein beta subunit